MRLYLRDPHSGRDSVTLTAFLIGFVVCITKLALAGMTIEGTTFSPFSGVDFAAAVGALGAIYGYRKASDNKGSNTTVNVVKTGKPPVEGEGE